ncbi:unnamed protein product, partial [Brenthis ino]
MLVYKEAEEQCLQKIIGYGTIMFLLLYVLRFIKYLGKRNKDTENDRRTAQNSHVTINADPGTDEKITKNRQRKRRRHKYIPEQWLAKDDPCSCHEFEDYE